MATITYNNPSGTRKSFTSAQLNDYRNRMSDITKGVQRCSAQAMKNATAALPQAQTYKPAYQMGQYQAGPAFNPGAYRGCAETIADQAIREGKSANEIARQRYIDQYNRSLGCINLNAQQDIGRNQAARNASLNALQNMGANTGLGYGGMAQNRLATSDTGFRGELNNLLAQYALQRGGLGAEQFTNLNELALRDADLAAGRQAAISKEMQNIVPMYQTAWQGNEDAARAAYDASVNNLKMLGDQFYTGEANNLAYGQAGVGAAQALADILMKGGGMQGDALTQFMQMLGQRY